MTRFKALPGRDYHHTQALPIRQVPIPCRAILHRDRTRDDRRRLARVPIRAYDRLPISGWTITLVFEW